MSDTWKHLVRVALPALVAIGLAACTSKPMKCFLEGKVTFQGEPVIDSHVVFFAPATGGGASAVLDVDGTFRVEGSVEPGEYLVTVVVPAPPPGTVMKMKEELPTPTLRFPEKYLREETTDLKVTVVPGPNQLNLTLKP